MNVRRPGDANHREGAVVVETAMVMPILLTVLWGIVEFGYAMMASQLATAAARDGVREAVLDGSTNAVVTERVRQTLIATLGRVQPSEITVVIEIDPAPGNPSPNHQLAAARTRDMCHITCTLPYHRVGILAGGWMKDAVLRGRCSMRHE